MRGNLLLIWKECTIGEMVCWHGRSALLSVWSCGKEEDMKEEDYLSDLSLKRRKGRDGMDIASAPKYYYFFKQPFLLLKNGYNRQIPIVIRFLSTYIEE